MRFICNITTSQLVTPTDNEQCLLKAAIWLKMHLVTCMLFQGCFPRGTLTWMSHGVSLASLSKPAKVQHAEKGKIDCYVINIGGPSNYVWRQFWCVYIAPEVAGRAYTRAWPWHSIRIVISCDVLVRVKPSLYSYSPVIIYMLLEFSSIVHCMVKSWWLVCCVIKLL